MKKPLLYDRPGLYLIDGMSCVFRLCWLVPNRWDELCVLMQQCLAPAVPVARVLLLYRRLYCSFHPAVQGLYCTQRSLFLCPQQLLNGYSCTFLFHCLLLVFGYQTGTQSAVQGCHYIIVQSKYILNLLRWAATELGKKDKLKMSCLLLSCATFVRGVGCLNNKPCRLFWGTLYF